jgi:glycerate 2-kinase
MLRSREIRYCGEATYIQLSTDERPPKLRVSATKKGYATLGHAESYAYAIEVLKRYRCWDRVAESIRRFLLAADPQYGFLTSEEKARMNYFRTIGPETMLEAARQRATELGVNAQILASSMSDVEASSAGNMMALMAQEIEVHGRPFEAPCAMICGGELLVTVGDSKGVGGRNQEFVLSTIPRIAGSNRVVVASVDSDGSDGPTEMAGAIADGYTLERAAEAGIDIFDEMHRHNSSPTLRKLGDAIYTGVRGTNIQDLRVVYVGPAD